MTLPPWKSDVPADQRALTQFVLAELDRLDARAANDASSDASSVSYLKKLVELTQSASRIGVSINVPHAPPRRGPKGRDPSSDDFTDLERAALDVPRIRAIFSRHWGKRNRMQRPLAEEIAAERWELSKADTASLIDKFQRKS